jgi:hypothetical protein
VDSACGRRGRRGLAAGRRCRLEGCPVQGGLVQGGLGVQEWRG